MKLVDSAIKKVKETVMDTFSGFQDGAKKSLTHIKASFDFAVDGEVAVAVQRVSEICKMTETLTKQVGTSKGSAYTQVGAVHREIDNLVIHQKDAVANHERQLEELKQGKGL